MIAYLDTCTILNLLQINYDDEYIKFLQKTFDHIKLTPKVFDELRKNKFINVVDDLNKVDLDNIIFGQLANFIDNSDCSDVLEFTRTHNSNCFKDNGESHSVSYSVQESRFGNDFGENLLKTHFITDDEPAKTDFDHFYNINLMGRILNSIDLMTIFWLKKYISKNQLITYCHSLKLLYNKDVGLLIIKLKDYSSKFIDELKTKQKIILTNFIEILNDLSGDVNAKITEILSKDEFKQILKNNKDWDNLISSVQKSNFREKIPYINERIILIEKIWEYN
ncbi:hypothetical protein [Chryseobacterium sp. JUb7]|uniref:hypothetical protein n=1 Tax=Chryseobacterium sp. JUb7 TaxID=2940599 RepID=UPI00216A166D|nr:hypothetical protein [Chryseobacterium sp. JUb7]MCS3532851.1 hypothetical protein [Chryseobacterium sp. JUb7]